MSYVVVNKETGEEHGYYRIDEARAVLVTLVMAGVGAYMYAVKSAFAL